ncbi:MAG: tetratricopeptide repeat protein, partial [Chloroflexota bacterium]
MAGKENIYQEAMNQGHSAAWDQDWGKAGEFYRKAVEEMPDSSQAIVSLGLAMFEQKKYNEAQQCYVRAAQMSPDDPFPVEKIAEINERTGKLKIAAEQSMAAADLWLKNKDADKAIENWTRVTRLFPEHLKAHSRLAVVHERLNRNNQAMREYISVAALFQDIGQIGEARQAIEKAVKLGPDDQEALDAYELVKNNKTLPKPRRSHGSTGALRMAAVQEMEEATESMPEVSQEGPDPFSEARQKALTALASILFDVSSDDLEKDGTAPRGLGVIFGSKKEVADLTKISVHLGLAIDYQTRAQDKQATIELQKAIKNGLHYPAAYYNLGMLFYNLNAFDKAAPMLLYSVMHPDYALTSRLMAGDMHYQSGRFSEAAEEYIEALKEADSAVISLDLVDGLRDQYETLVETLPQQDDEEELKKLCRNIIDMVVRPNWRQHLTSARMQLPGGGVGPPPLPIVEILTEAQNSDIVGALTYIDQLARDGFLRSAVEEAFNVMQNAPTYLPLHIQIGELLLRQDRTQEAIN